MFIFGVNNDNTSGSGMFLLQEQKGIEMSLSCADKDGWNGVGIDIDVRLTDQQVNLIRRKFGTQTINRDKCERVYKAIVKGLTNAEIARMGDFGERRIADIRAALSPSR